MLSKIYLALGSGIVALFALASYYGWEFSSSQQRQLPEDVRQSAGGIRSYHYWHEGYQGGK